MENLFSYLESKIPVEYRDLYQAWVKEMREVISLENFLHAESESGEYNGLENFSKSALVKALDEAWSGYVIMGAINDIKSRNAC